MKQIKYDLVLIGATGFTGKLVAEYIAKEYGVKNENFVWAIAGRNQNKLNHLRDHLKEIDPKIDIQYFRLDWLLKDRKYRLNDLERIKFNKAT